MAVPWPTQQNLVIAFSFLGFVLVNIPLYWHLEGMYDYCPQIIRRGLTWFDSMEYWMYYVHLLERLSVPYPVHQLYYLEEQCHQLGTCVV